MVGDPDPHVEIRIQGCCLLKAKANHRLVTEMVMEEVTEVVRQQVVRQQMVVYLQYPSLVEEDVVEVSCANILHKF